MAFLLPTAFPSALSCQASSSCGVSTSKYVRPVAQHARRPSTTLGHEKRLTFSLSSLRRVQFTKYQHDPMRLADGGGVGDGRGGHRYGGSNGSNKGGGDGDDKTGGPPHFSVAAAIAMAKRPLRDLDSWTRMQRQSDALQNLVQSVRISHLLLALNVAIFAIQSMYGPNFLMSGAKVNSAIASGEYYRLLSPMFLHASASHLLVNSFSLHSTGPSVESWFGKARFFALYIASGISGNLLSYFCSPTPAVGASGAIFGLVGASVVILSRHHRILGPRARRGLQSLAYIVLMNFGMGMSPGSRIDNFGHLGGFLGGISFSYLVGPRLVVRRGRSGRTTLQDEPIWTLALAELRGRLKYLRSLLMGR